MELRKQSQCLFKVTRIINHPGYDEYTLELIHSSLSLKVVGMKPDIREEIMFNFLINDQISTNILIRKYLVEEKKLNHLKWDYEWTFYLEENQLMYETSKNI